MREAAKDLVHRQVVVGDKVGVPMGGCVMAKATVIKITPKGCKVAAERPTQYRDNKTGQLLPGIRLEEKLVSDLNFVKLETPIQGVYEIWET